MKYKLKKDIIPNLPLFDQIFVNRGIPKEKIYRYINTTDEEIYSPLLLGEDKLKAGAKMLIETISQNKNILVICDCDADGFTSSALLLNYLHDCFPTVVEDNLKWYVHSDKQHGMSDVMDYINQKDFSLIICPDAATNDSIYQKELKERNIDTLVLDHHLSEGDISDDAVIINNQICGYPNKDLSGVGIVWQFCRYIDNLMNTNYAEGYLDLVALGCTADMMSLTSFETKHLINKGFEPSRVKNPYIYEMWQKNKFKLGDHFTSMDAAFYIVPMVNAIQRSGTIEEKELLFKSMLKYEAFKMIPSTKRGAKGTEERIVDQAVRTSTNVKNRQTKVQDESLIFLEDKIKNGKLLEHKVIILQVDKDDINKNIGGLIANKLATKYQRPCCILIKTVDKENSVQWQGSARGYEANGLKNFKGVCEDSNLVNWTAGHHNAFGISVSDININNFISYIDNALKDMSAEPVYYVDYIYNGADINPIDILDISSLKGLWGKDFDEVLIAVKGIKITKEMVTIFRKTTNTLKITLPNKISLMKFNVSDDECEMFENQSGAYIQIDLVGKCNRNEWNGSISPQIMIEEYEVTGAGKYLF